MFTPRAPKFPSQRALTFDTLAIELMDGVEITAILFFLSVVTIAAVKWKLLLRLATSTRLPSSAELKGFFCRPWPLRKSFYVAIALGAVAPMLHALFPPVLVLCLGVVLIYLLYRQVDRTEFRTGWKALSAAIIAGGLLTLGLIGSAFCFRGHICMGGHMEHPPYSPRDYGLDIGWALCLVVAALVARWQRLSLSIGFGAVIFFILSYRFLFGSMGGRYVWLPL